MTASNQRKNMQNTLQFQCFMLYHFLPGQLQLLQIFWKPASLAHLLNTIMPSSEEESSLEGSEDYEETDDEDEDVQPDEERQISVDPMSLKHAAKPKFVSCSLPCSATSSPQWCSSCYLTKEPHPAIRSLVRRHSVAPSRFVRNRQALGLFRSKSCGDGRSSQPYDEFDILSRPPVNTTKPPVVKYSKNPEDIQATWRKREDEEFKCGALCLFLPAFSKKKPEVHSSRAREGEKVKDNAIDDGEERRSALSRVASLEKFECASWASSAVPDEEEFEGRANAYFDLPLELIRGTGDDANSPVKAAFIFDGERKGGLKKSSSKTGARKSCEFSNRHVRFSTSAPVLYPPSPSSACITPRLLKAREEFNALLEAHNACINF